MCELSWPEVGEILMAHVVSAGRVPAGEYHFQWYRDEHGAYLVATPLPANVHLLPTKRSL